MQPQTPANSYDQVPYPTFPLPQTHPRRLETIAWLLSLSPPSSLNCRVLELGCGDGGNLIPMAMASPECQFIGVDASAIQIDTGRALISELQLNNIQLEHCSIEQLDSSWGYFDYIICHGVFSWVPAQVQKAILRLVDAMLSENGLGYISYNTQPGWHGRGAIRNMMGYHVGRYPQDSPQGRIRRAREMLEFLTRATANTHNSFGLLLRENLTLLNQLPDAYLFHEHLEEFNEPIWFLDFCDMLANQGLRYLGEADFSTMVAPLGLSKELQKELSEFAPHLLEKEQYLDFLRNRSFRQTLICRMDQRPNYDVRAERIQQLCIGSPVNPKLPSVDLSAGVVLEYEIGGEAVLSTQVPIFKAALIILHQVWPSLIPFNRVLGEASKLLLSAGIEENNLVSATALAKALLMTYSSTSQSIIELARQPPQFMREISAAPLASPLARAQVRTFQLVSNLRQESVQLTESDSFLLSKLDGRHALHNLERQFFQRFPEKLDEVAAVHASTQEEDGQKMIEVPSDSARRVFLAHLECLARHALLIG